VITFVSNAERARGGGEEKENIVQGICYNRKYFFINNKVQNAPDAADARQENGKMCQTYSAHYSFKTSRFAALYFLLFSF